MTATGSDGKKFFARPDSNGIYEFELPFGKYRIEASAAGFCQKVFDDYKVVDAAYKKMSLDFVLYVQNSADCPPKCEPDPRDKSNVTICM